MADQTPKMKVEIQEPYSNFNATLHMLMMDQIEFTRLRILIIKVAIGLVIVYIVISFLLCILSILLPLFGISIAGWIINQILGYKPQAY
jgi:hypothetical protein